MRIPQRAPGLEQALRQVSKSSKSLQKILAVQEVDGKGRYLHWDDLRRRTPPAGLTHDEWWAGIKLRRGAMLSEFGLVGREGRPFRVAVPSVVQRGLHRVDKQTAGLVLFEEATPTSAHRDRYLMGTLMEEAITSSQIEGAATTRKVAKEMLRSGRPPTTRGEQMIVNNFRTMERIRELVDEPLTPELVRELQAEVTRDALDDPTAIGRLRRRDEEISVVEPEGQVLHRPPDARELPQRLAALCEFANSDDDQPFIHPVVRSILVHFWLAYDHPFVDGNGRTARALFYWSMLRREYWLFEFLSISRIIAKAKVQYGRAFLHAETDENDATYFLIHQLGVIDRAIDDLHEYLRRKMHENKTLSSILRASVDLNHRQQALLTHALRHPETEYTIEGHRRSHGVSYQTARTDLLDLETRKLLVRVPAGRRFVFEAAKDLERRLPKLR